MKSTVYSIFVGYGQFNEEHGVRYTPLFLGYQRQVLRLLETLNVFLREKKGNWASTREGSERGEEF